MSRQTIRVYGASDDLIEVEGDIVEEYYAVRMPDETDGGMLAFSDGTILRMRYTDEGVWEIRPERQGYAVTTIRYAEGPDTDRYSDVAEILVPWDMHPIQWVMFGTQWKAAKEPAPVGPSERTS